VVNSTSTFRTVRSSVLQGSLLGSILFIDTVDLFCSDLKVNLYVDDVKLNMAIHDISSVAVLQFIHMWPRLVQIA